ncbi:MAG: TMEM175 family protein [Bacteroidota bacterium]|nr:TMEM175 family protein [Bacteroidota bacterium]
MQNQFKTNRIEALTDGVFAIAMTIMVLTIDIPEKDLGLTGHALHQVLLRQLHQVLSYITSFLLLAVLWIIHHKQYGYIKATNQTHIWINILILIFICLVPYTTNLTSDFPDDWMTHLYFNSNMLIVALLYFLNWSYAMRKKELASEKTSPEMISKGKQNILSFVTVSVLAIGLSFIWPAWSSMAYLLLFILMKR